MIKNISTTQLKKEEVLTGAQIIIESLKKEKVEYIFGYPGAIILPIYDELYNCDEIKHYLVRHEQAAVHAAEGYARVTGKPGIVLVTSGPGACNTLTAIANAYYDSYPLVVITGQVDSRLIGNDAFQEADVVGITRSCCKHNYLVKDVNNLAKVIKEAFHIASTGKPGPVIIDVPKDVIDSKAKFIYPEKIKLPGYNPKYSGHHLQNLKALSLLYQAERPLIISGGGVVISDACKELFELAKVLKVPVANTLMGTGSYPADDSLSLGMLGMFGNYWANDALDNCDILFAIGTRFSDRVTGDLSKFCKNAKIIHIDIDPCSIGKNVFADIPIVGDIKLVLKDMLSQLDREKAAKYYEEKQAWLNKIKHLKTFEVKNRLNTEFINPQTVIEKIYEYSKDKDAIITTEVGQHQMWTARLYKFNKPRRFITSGGLGTMGFGYPAAMGIQIADPNKLVIDIAGDGSIQMNIQELATCVKYNLPVKVCIINNGCLGMVRQLQQKFFNENYSETIISGPDYVKLAEAYGAKGFRVTNELEIDSVIKEAFETDGPVLIDFVVEPFEVLYPWSKPEIPNSYIPKTNWGGK